jgi:hypothetical protein
MQARAATPWEPQGREGTLEMTWCQSSDVMTHGENMGEMKQVACAAFAVPFERACV